MTNFLKKIPLKIVLAFVVVISFYLLSAIGQASDGDLHVYFLDVGQGDSILIETPQDKHILIDSGEGDDVVSELSKVSSVLMKDIDLGVLTHPHIDHLGGFLHLKEYYVFHQIIQMPVEYTSDAYIEWLEYLDETNIEVNSVLEGDIINIEEDLSFKVLWPRDIESLGSFNLNNTSIVLLMKYRDFTVLFMGDIEKEVEEYLVSHCDLNANVLKVGHHGSNTSSTEEFVSKVLPQISVISVGENNFGHPSDDVIKRLEEKGSVVYRTDIDGTVEIVSDGEKFWVEK